MTFRLTFGVVKIDNRNDVNEKTDTIVRFCFNETLSVRCDMLSYCNWEKRERLSMCSLSSLSLSLELCDCNFVLAANQNHLTQHATRNQWVAELEQTLLSCFITCGPEQSSIRGQNQRQ